MTRHIGKLNKEIPRFVVGRKRYTVILYLSAVPGRIFRFFAHYEGSLLQFAIFTADVTLGNLRRVAVVLGMYGSGGRNAA